MLALVVRRIVAMVPILLITSAAIYLLVTVNGNAAVTLAGGESATPQQIYSQGPCAENAQASCFDMNRWTSVSGVSVPPFPFQNRPTFQQTVELTQTLPR